MVNMTLFETMGLTILGKKDRFVSFEWKGAIIWARQEIAAVKPEGESPFEYQLAAWVDQLAVSF
jgi:hypothetical protein